MKKKIEPTDKILNTSDDSLYSFPNIKETIGLENKNKNKNPMVKKTGNAVALRAKLLAFKFESNEENLEAKTVVKLPPN